MGDEKNDALDAQRDEAFARHVNQARQIVGSWPEWKQRAILGRGSSEDSPGKERERTSECSDNDRNGNGKG
jgi:hypothetical protein